MALPKAGLFSHPSWRAVAFASLFACACAGSTTAANAPTSLGEPASEAKVLERLSLEPVPLRPMTDAERSIEQSLRQNVTALLSAGERHSGNEWGLASATDLLAAYLEALGISVQREGFAASGGGLGQNLVVNLPGAELPSEVVLIGAQYDSAPGSPGADDNATGAAALLEVAKSQYGKTRRRTLRLVWFSDASGRTQAESMGAWHHLELAAKPRRDDEPAPIGTKLEVCVDLHGLGAFSESMGSQKYAPGMPTGHPIGEFIEVLSLPQYMAQGNAVATALGHVSSVPIRSVTTLDSQTTPMTPFAAFSAHGCPAVLVHDTGSLRFQEFGKAGDTIERIDFGRFARVVDALTRATDAWVNGPALGEALPSSAISDVTQAPVNTERQNSSDHTGE